MNVAAVKSFYDRTTSTFTHVVADPQTRRCAVIDPVLGYHASIGRTDTTPLAGVLDHIREQNYVVDWILETHAHADHLSGAQYLQASSSAKVAIGAHITEVQQIFSGVFNLHDLPADGSQFDHLFVDEESFCIGKLQATVLHTPGHTPACVTYLVNDCAFVGDTLFMPDYGTARTDFPGGDAATLYQSIQRIYQLGGQTQLFMCHDYPNALPKKHRRKASASTTVAAEQTSNIHIHTGVTQDDFVHLRNQRDANLPPPDLLLPAIQVNIRAGHWPQPEDNGLSYLKIPIDSL